MTFNNIMIILTTTISILYCLDFFIIIYFDISLRYVKDICRHNNNSQNVYPHTKIEDAQTIFSKLTAIYHDTMVTPSTPLLPNLCSVQNMIFFFKEGSAPEII